MKEKNLTTEAVMAKLRTVMDPEIHKDLVSLGMIKDVEINGSVVNVTVVLTTPACPLKNKIKSDVESAILDIPGVETVNVKMDAHVRGSKDATGIENLNIKNIIAISSGKGGVGKSTMAVNIAVSLAKSGAKVGLMDADIYGPNIPTMMGLDKMPNPQNGKLMPAEAFGVKVISIGFLVKDGQPLIWARAVASRHNQTVHC